MAHKQWHISRWPSIMLVPVAIVAAIVVQLGTSLFGLKKSVGLTPTEVRGYLENFLDGSSGA